MTALSDQMSTDARYPLGEALRWSRLKLAHRVGSSLSVSNSSPSSRLCDDLRERPQSAGDHRCSLPEGFNERVAERLVAYRRYNGRQRVVIVSP